MRLKKLVAFAIAFAMVMGVVPAMSIPAFAEGSSVAAVDETEYSSLQEAIEAAQELYKSEPVVVTLLSDTNESFTLKTGIVELVTGGYSCSGTIAVENAILLSDSKLEVECAMEGANSDKTKFGFTGLSFGAEMVEGAQVRIGGGVDEDGKIAGSGSGLRFITTVNRSDTLANYALECYNAEEEAYAEGYGMGVKITAEGSTSEIVVDATLWQTEGDAFTSALTNIKEGNYNRSFTARPFIKIEGVEFNGDDDNTSTRSIYQVAAGKLIESDDSASMSRALVNVLNAYVNQTGVRLTLTDNTEEGELKARTTGSGAYTGDAFFEVSDTSFSDGKYKVTLTPLGNSVINVSLFSEYVRINNNNTKVKEDTFIEENEDGTYTLTFDYGKMLPRQFDVKLPNTDDYLYRVGNANTVALGSLFEAVDDAQIGTASVTVKAVEGEASGTYTANASDWTKGVIQFTGTGVVKVTVTDNNYCTPTELYLEVVDAKNVTTATSAISSNVVLLNDISGTFTVSNGYTFYGNGFTVTLPTTSVKNTGNGFTGYISIGATVDGGIANGGHLDNVRIEGPVYPEMYIYRDQAKITDTSDPDYGDGNNMRYFTNSVIVYGGNVTISNCYISGSRTALCLRGGNNVVIENTTLSGGAYANMQIGAGSRVTLRDVTTVQTDVADSYGKGKTAHGLGIAVDSSVVDLYIEGELNQYNWLCEEQWNSIVPSTYQSFFPKFFTNSTFSKYWHYLNGGTAPYVNMAFIYACNWDTNKIHDNRETVDYETCDATIASVNGGVYTKVNTVGGNAITDSDLADPGYTSAGFNPVAPKFEFDNTLNYDADDESDASDTYCVYDESSGTLKLGLTSDSKTIDLSGVSITKNGTALEYTAYLNEAAISGDSITIKSADGAKQTLVFKATSNDAGYDAGGQPIEGSIEYTWTVTVEVATLAYPAPVWNMGGTYQFDKANCVYAYYLTTQGYGEAVPIYEGIKVNYYNKSGTLVELDLSGTTTLPTGSDNSNSNAFTYTLEDGSTLTMKYLSGWKSGATTHEFTTYNNKVYIYPQSLDNDNYVRANTTSQDFDVKITYTFTDPNGQSTGTVTMRWYNAAASNGKVSTVQWKTFDSTNGKTLSCVTPDTLVTLADGSQKEIQYVTDEDLFVVWDFYKGEYAYVPGAVVINHGENIYDIITLNFDDGSSLKIVDTHGLYSSDLNEWVYIDDQNVKSFVGMKFAKTVGDTITEIELIDYSVKEEKTTAYSLFTALHYNCFFENILTLTPSMFGGENYYVPFEMGEGMKYDEALMQADIEEYGLYTYEDFADYVTYEQFVGFNAPYFKVSVGKGMVTYEQLIESIYEYVNAN